MSDMIQKAIEVVTEAFKTKAAWDSSVPFPQWRASVAVNALVKAGWTPPKTDETRGRLKEMEAAWDRCKLQPGFIVEPLPPEDRIDFKDQDGNVIGQLLGIGVSAPVNVKRSEIPESWIKPWLTEPKVGQVWSNEKSSDTRIIASISDFRITYILETGATEAYNISYSGWRRWARSVNAAPLPVIRKNTGETG